MTKVKPDLAATIRDQLEGKYGSVPKASEQLGLPYERVKKALQRNRFSDDDLAVLIPGESPADLKRTYEFSHARAYFRSHEGEAAVSGALPAGKKADDFALFNAIGPAFQWLQKASNATDFDEFVSDIYEKLDKQNSMVLFCHTTSIPIEWQTQDKALIQDQATAIDNGAIILYIMESDTVSQVIHENTNVPNDIDREFAIYLGAVNAKCKNQKNCGFIALLRVPHCAFCIPHQKPALFSTTDSAGTLSTYRALTTIELPATVDGQGRGRILAVPQRKSVADAMIKYLRQLLGHLRKNDRANHFRFKSFPSKSENDYDNLVEKLASIVE